MMMVAVGHEMLSQNAIERLIRTMKVQDVDYDPKTTRFRTNRVLLATFC